MFVEGTLLVRMRGLLTPTMLIARVVLIHESEIRGEHFVVLRGKILFARVSTFVTGLLKVEVGAHTDVADSVDMEGKFAEEINDFVAALRQGIPEDEGCEYYAENFLEEDGNFG